MAETEKRIWKKKPERETKPRRTRFTVLDFFLVIVVLLAVLGIGFRSAIAELFVGAEPGEEVAVRFKVEKLTRDEAEGLRKNDALFLDGEEIGQLSDFAMESQKTVIKETDETGSILFVTVADPNLYTVRGTMILLGHYGEEGLTVGEGESLYVGKILNIYTSSYSLTVTITEIPRK